MQEQISKNLKLTVASTDVQPKAAPLKWRKGKDWHKVEKKGRGGEGRETMCGHFKVHYILSVSSYWNFAGGCLLPVPYFHYLTIWNNFKETRAWKTWIPDCHLGKQLSHFACPGPLLTHLNPLGPTSDQHQFSPNNISRSSRVKVTRITRLITL